ncbi:MAG TPA: hypothetical protein VNQ48_00205 [Microbacteriaceae bacterium]|nr:hypothetical protein [Microbacteriaceae bacterium]
MAEIAAAPVFVKMPVQIGSNGQTAHIRSATLTPSTRVERYTDVGGNDHVVGADTVAWQLALDAIQDHATATGLQRFMLSNIGVELSCTATVPGGSYAFKIIGSPLPAGGTGGSLATGTMTYEAFDVVFTAAGS